MEKKPVLGRDGKCSNTGRTANVARLLILWLGQMVSLIGSGLTFAFSVLTFVMINVPDLAVKPTAKPSLRKQAAQGWRHIMDQPGLKTLLLLFIMLNITSSFYQALITAIILGFTNFVDFGPILSGIGSVLGSLLLSVWGGLQRRINGLPGFAILYSVGLILSGLRASTAFLTIAVFLTLFFAPFINGCNQIICQLKSALQVQCRVFAIRTMIGWSSSPLIYSRGRRKAKQFIYANRSYKLGYGLLTLESRISETGL